MNKEKSYIHENASEIIVISQKNGICKPISNSSWNCFILFFKKNMHSWKRQIFCLHPPLSYTLDYWKDRAITFEGQPGQEMDKSEFKPPVSKQAEQSKAHYYPESCCGLRKRLIIYVCIHSNTHTSECKYTYTVMFMFA